jgi:hypothetical protein
MGLIADIVDAALAIGGAVIVNLISIDISEQTPVLARKLITCAVRGLPAAQRERYLEEWLAHLDECKGTIPKLVHSVGCVVCASTLAKTLAREQRCARQAQLSMPLSEMWDWAWVSSDLPTDTGFYITDTSFAITHERDGYVLVANTSVAGAPPSVIAICLTLEEAQAAAEGKLATRLNWLKFQTLRTPRYRL